ncbi:MAG: hypothetical protein OEZ55_14335 [Nitrospinota bacterium]|nr:hypothetical protein [Nitrospinota bacterium]
MQDLTKSNNAEPPPEKGPGAEKSQPGPVFVRMKVGGQDMIDQLEELRKKAEAEGNPIVSLRWVKKEE